MSEWISCDERMPDCKYGHFLVTRKYYSEGSEPHVMPSFYIQNRDEARSQNKYYSRKLQGKNSVHFDACESGFIITHWMPFPEPPKE